MVEIGKKEDVVKFAEVSAEEVLGSIELNEDKTSEEIYESIIDEEKTEIVTPRVKKKVKVSKETTDLYNEFSDFLEVKADIIQSSGVKPVSPTGIDLLDAILGGGFAIGALNIIVGQPGSGKCLEFNEEIDIYVEE